MAHNSHLAYLKILLGLVALMAAVSANAALLDCTQSQVLFSNEDCLASGNLSYANNAYGVTELSVALPAVVVKAKDFEVSQNGNSAISGPVPLIGLVFTVLVVLLVRARAVNTK